MLLFRLIGLLVDLVLLPLRALRRARAVPRGAFVALTIDGPVVDIAARPRLWWSRAPRATSIWSVTELVDEVLEDPRVRGIYVVLQSLDAGMAAASSLRAQLARARAAGKEVVVHLPMGGATKETLVASAATKVLLGPTAQLAPLGFLSTSRYLRRALDKAGIEPDVLACGEYKSAGESLMRDTMSEPQREQLGELLTTFHGALVAAIAEGRSVTTERAEALIDGAPYFGKAAVRAGLADGALYDDEVPGALGLAGEGTGSGSAGKASTRMFVPAGAYHAMRTKPLLRPVLRRPRIAVIPVHGPITHVTGAFGRLATDERVIRMVRVARMDPGVVGVILHVDSPGGSALASDRMHHEIAQLARHKPLVACMGNVAASGGYYVAAPAHRVVCEATTITGSIGVVAARLSIEPLLARLGITTESVRRGARAGLLSPGTPISGDERGALLAEMDATYAAFVGVVASGRKMTAERVETLARGRVYSGKQAVELGLVDALGGFEQAMAELRRMLPSEVRERARPSVVRVPRRHVPLLDPPSSGEAGRRALDAVLGVVLSEGERVLLELAASGERVVALWTGPTR